MSDALVNEYTVKTYENGYWVHRHIDEWGVFTTMCGEKFLATCKEYTLVGGDVQVLENAISFRIELVPQRGGVVRVPFVGGVDLCTAPASIRVHVCSVYWLEGVGDSDKKQYAALIRHAVDQMTAARAQQSGLVLP